MTVRTALAPLVRGTTYRRAVHLLLGGVILLPYLQLGAIFQQLFHDAEAPRAVTLLLLATALGIGGVPAFLRGTRSLEIAAARLLLGVDLPDPPVAAPLAPETRMRAALWFAVHLVIGGLVGFGLLLALPMALVFIAQRFGVAVDTLAELPVGGAWLSALGVLLLIALIYAIAGLGALAALMAPVLLGPSPTERIADLEARAGRWAERNRLARELHDSVGHALTVTTLQAAAAREVLDSDPEFARRALGAIEETGRGAMAELDYVLGVLREHDGQPSVPQRTLADLDRLVADARGAGLAVSLDVDGALGELPAMASRAGYRIVQEGLTNAARHAGGAPVTLRIAVTDRALAIELANPVPLAAGTAGGGRGLTGMRERVSLLGGQVSARREDGVWRVRVRLPIGGAP